MNRPASSPYFSVVSAGVSLVSGYAGGAGAGVTLRQVHGEFVADGQPPIVEPPIVYSLMHPIVYKACEGYVSHLR